MKPKYRIEKKSEEENCPIKPNFGVERGSFFL